MPVLGERLPDSAISKLVTHLDRCAQSTRFVRGKLTPDFFSGVAMEQAEIIEFGLRNSAYFTSFAPFPSHEELVPYKNLFDIIQGVNPTPTDEMAQLFLEGGLRSIESSLYRGGAKHARADLLTVSLAQVLAQTPDLQEKYVTMGLAAAQKFKQERANATLYQELFACCRDQPAEMAILARVEGDLNFLWGAKGKFGNNARQYMSDLVGSVANEAASVSAATFAAPCIAGLIGGDNAVVIAPCKDPINDPQDKGLFVALAVKPQADDGITYVIPAGVRREFPNTQEHRAFVATAGALLSNPQTLPRLSDALMTRIRDRRATAGTPRATA